MVLAIPVNAQLVGLEISEISLMKCYLVSTSLIFFSSMENPLFFLQICVGDSEFLREKCFLKKYSKPPLLFEFKFISKITKIQIWEMLTRFFCMPLQGNVAIIQNRIFYF